MGTGLEILTGIWPQIEKGELKRGIAKGVFPLAVNQ